MPQTRRLELDTLCAHAGLPRRPTAGAAPHSHVTPLYQVSVFDFASIEESLPALAGQGYAYRRYGVPNTDELGEAIAALEEAPAGVATGSGMGAIAAAVLSIVRAGDRIVCQRDAYGGTRGFFDADLARLGVAIDYVDVYDQAAFARAIDGAAVALVETVSNPLLRCIDLAAIVDRAHQANAKVIVDNTFATPLRDRPITSGADLVIHSATKFLGGHHDLCAGAVVGASELVNAARGVIRRMGLHAAPLEAWLAVRGIRTLALRMQHAWRSAAVLAQRLHDARLGDSRRLENVYSSDRCALVSFDLGSRVAAERVVAAFELITLSPSLGGVTTTASHPASSSHASLSEAERREAGIGDGILRLSIGIESVEDVWADLERALGQASGA